MVLLQQMPDEVLRFISQHNLVRADVQALEQPESLQRAITQVAGLVMRSFAELAGQPSTLDALWHAASEAAAVEPATAATAAPGGNLLRKVLDDRYHGTVSATAAATGVSVATVSYLLGLVPAAALVIIGALVAEQRWTAQQLAEWLRPRHQVPVVPVPAPVSLAPPVAPRVVARPALAPAATPGLASWFTKPTNVLLVVMSVVAAAEFGYILATRPEGSAATETIARTPVAGPVVSSGATSERYAAGPVANRAAPPRLVMPVVLRLKNGTRQFIKATSTESKLYRFLIDPSQEVNLVDPTKNRIGFDRIAFDAGKATLTSESLWQLANVASILKRFPAAKVKIGDYTGAAGKPSPNPRLYQQRAEAIKRVLVRLGVPADHLAATAYEAPDPTAGSDTDPNPRVSLQVIQK
ncbi:OmpA family protein [Hymenobacter bucti]|uniref:OmpA family protein n=1 Tax=Hymenobacter bucti TaxID=1844114 RepID=A0ABW4QQI3_9BACT